MPCLCALLADLDCEPLGNPRFSHSFLHGETTVSPTPFAFESCARRNSLRSFAAGLGFEPRYTAPEAVVLPLDDPAIN